MVRAEAHAVYAPCFWLCLIAFLTGARYARAKFSPQLQFMRLRRSLIALYVTSFITD